MIWHVRFFTFAEKDWKSFDRYHQKVIDKAIQKVMQNPTADGYGKPLANLSGSHLHGLYKIKLKKSGIRIVYALIEVEGEMLIIIIGARANDEVYDLAAKRYARMKKSEDNNSRTEEASLAGSLFLLCCISEQGNKFSQLSHAKSSQLCYT